MAPRKPNYNFERQERDRLKAQKLAVKAEAKRQARERGRDEGGEPPPSGDA